MKNLQRALLDSLGKRMAGLGFAVRLAEHSFTRPFSGGRASLHLAFIRHPEDFDVVADVGVRFDALEELINAQNPLLTNKEKTKTYSLGAEIGNIAGTGQRRWGIESIEDVEDVARKIFSDFERIGLPYLEKASELSAAYEMLAAPGRSGWLHSPINSARAKRIIGLARLLGLDSEIPRQIEENIRFMESINDGGLRDFKCFAKNFIA